MIVVQLGYSYKNDAQGVIVQAIERRLDELNIPNYVIFSEEGSHSTSTAKQCNPPLLSLVRRALNKIFGKKKEHSYLQTSIALFWLKRIKPDIVHLHVIHHCYYDFERLFKYLKEQDCKIIFTIHDMWIMTGGCYHFTDIGCNKFQNGCNNCPGKFNMDCSTKLTERNYQIKRRFVEDKHVQFTAVSEWVKETAATSYIPYDSIRTISNGIDTNIFCPRKTKKKIEDKVYIVGVANEWSEDKGIISFLELAKLLGPDFIIDLIGNCPQKYKENSPDNVNFVGRIINKNELANKYREANVFLHLSKCETFGMVIAEAACCGTPVIAYRTSGIEEVVKRVNGTLVNIDDLDSIIRILNQYKSKGVISRGNVNDFISSFSIETMVNKYINFYQEISNGEL